MVEKDKPLRESIKNLNAPAIIAFGNPLLDMFVKIKDNDLLKKYNLNVDGEAEFSEDKMQELLADIPQESKQVVYPGGSAQNTMRIIQWLYDETFQNQYCIFSGAIGNDCKGIMLQSLVRSTGVDARYVIHSNLNTGQCIILISEPYRSLVANVGAAAKYTLNDLKACNLSFDRIKIIYIEGFFIPHSFPVIKELVKQAEERDIIIAFNINGTYIFNDFRTAVCEMIGHSNIVFGNSREMEALAQSLNLTYDDVSDIPFLLNSLKRITINVCNTVKKDWLRHGGVFVMTQGASAPAIAVWGKSQSAQVLPIKSKIPIIDTIDTDDALAAGFLAGVLARWKPKRCLEYGCKIASYIGTIYGIKLPDNVPSDLLE